MKTHKNNKNNNKTDNNNNSSINNHVNLYVRAFTLITEEELSLKKLKKGIYQNQVFLTHTELSY